MELLQTVKTYMNIMAQLILMIHIYNKKPPVYQNETIEISMVRSMIYRIELIL